MNFKDFWKSPIKKRMTPEDVSALLFGGKIDQLREKLIKEEGMNPDAANDYIVSLQDMKPISNVNKAAELSLEGNTIKIKLAPEEEEFDFQPLGDEAPMNPEQELPEPGARTSDILNLKPDTNPAPGYSFVNASHINVGDTISNLGRVMRIDRKAEGGINVFATNGNVYYDDNQPVQIKKTFQNAWKYKSTK